MFPIGWLIAGMVWIGCVGVAHADCVPGSVERGIEDAAAIFVGRVRTIHSLGGPEAQFGEWYVTVEFDVSQAWKGIAGPEVVLHTVTGWMVSTDYDAFEEGEEFLVFAFMNEDGTLGTTSCSYTMRTDDERARDVFAALGSAPARAEDARRR